MIRFSIHALSWPPEKLDAQVIGFQGWGTSWSWREAAMVWRRASFLRFSLASSWAKTSGLNGCLNLSRCQSPRARWTRSLPLARPCGPSAPPNSLRLWASSRPLSRPYGLRLRRILFATSQVAQVCAPATIPSAFPSRPLSRRTNSPLGPCARLSAFGQSSPPSPPLGNEGEGGAEDFSLLTPVSPRRAWRWRRVRRCSGRR